MGNAGRLTQTNFNQGRIPSAGQRSLNQQGLGWRNQYAGNHQQWMRGNWSGGMAGNRTMVNNFNNFGFAGGRGFGGWGYPGWGNGGWGVWAGIRRMGRRLGPRMGRWLGFPGLWTWGFGLGYGLGLGGWGYGLGGLWGLGYPGWGWGGMGYGGWGYPGWGLSSWNYGPMLYNWGYSSYDNPYYDPSTMVVQQPIVYDYSQPIDPTVTPPAQSVNDQALLLFDEARARFKAGDMEFALRLTDQALGKLPNDSALHEFRALVQFALGRYDEAATALYAVLSVGPGWDWETLIGLYPNVDVYTQQLRALESQVQQNPQSTASRFVLAYHYLTTGHVEAAIPQLREITQASAAESGCGTVAPAT